MKIVIELGEYLPRWLDQIQPGIEWRIGSSTADKHILCVKKIIAVLVKHHVSIKEQHLQEPYYTVILDDDQCMIIAYHIVFDQLQNTYLGAVDGGSKGIKRLRVPVQ